MVPEDVMPDEEFEKHEDICEQCGRCCRKKTVIFGEIVATTGTCDFLGKDNKCVCYKNRFQAYPQCRPVAQAMLEGLLPPDCPYVRDFPGYKCAVERWM